MRRMITTVVLLAVFGVTAWAAEKDTPAAANTRLKKMKVKVTVDFKEEFLKDALDEINDKIEEAGFTKLSIKWDTGVSKNQRVSFKGDKVNAEDAIAGLLEKNMLGYIIVSKPKDRYDGWMLIKMGKERGYAKGEEPKEEKKDK